MRDKGTKMHLYETVRDYKVSQDYDLSIQLLIVISAAHLIMDAEDELDFSKVTLGYLILS